MTREQIREMGSPSATRLKNYLTGKPVYLGAPVMVYPVVQGQPSMSYQPFDEGLMRHDIHVLLYLSSELGHLAGGTPE